MKIFCDLDGVLSDFVKQARVHGCHDFSSRTVVWQVVRQKNFFKKMPMIADADLLWGRLAPYNPTILSGVTSLPKPAVCGREKYEWCKSNLVGRNTNLVYLDGDDPRINHVDMAGSARSHKVVTGRLSSDPGVLNVITCWSKNKHRESGPGCVLIDDNPSLAVKWEAAGGIFVHHEDAITTIAKLEELGVVAVKMEKTEEH